MYCIHDSKARAYLAPFFYREDGEAQRAFSAAARAEDHNFHIFAEDYTLFHVGSFDQDTAQVTPLVPPNCIARALDYRGHETTETGPKPKLRTVSASKIQGGQ